MRDGYEAGNGPKMTLARRMGSSVSKPGGTLMLNSRQPVLSLYDELQRNNADAMIMSMMESEVFMLMLKKMVPSPFPLLPIMHRDHFRLLQAAPRLFQSTEPTCYRTANSEMIVGSLLRGGSF